MSSNSSTAPRYSKDARSARLPTNIAALATFQPTHSAVILRHGGLVGLNSTRPLPSSTWASPQTNTRYATAHALASFGTGAVTADTSPPAAMQPVPVITKGALSAYWACLIDPMVRGGDSQFRWRQLGHQGRIGTDHTEFRSAAR